MTSEDRAKLEELELSLENALNASRGAGRNTYQAYGRDIAKIRAQILNIKSKYSAKQEEREVGPTIDDALEKIRFFMRPKQPRVALPRKQYIALKKYILERDTYCLFCGRTDTLTPAHIKRRSAGGHDAPNNVILACQKCHDEFDQYKIELPFLVAEMLENEPDTWEKK